MTLRGRAVITHLLCLAAGLLLGIFLSQKNQPGDVRDPAPVEGLALPASAAPQVGVGTTEAAAVDLGDPALRKLRADYEDQLRRGEQRQAVLILQEMERKGPKSQIYLETNSDYQIYARDWAAATLAARACVGVFPKSRICYRNLATAAVNLGNAEDQAAAVDQCLALEPNDPHCRNILGLVQSNHGDYNAAIETFQRLIRENGSFGAQLPEDQLEWHLGLALEGAGRRDEAIDHLENACRRNFNPACEKIEELSGGALQ